ncbi:MAG: arginine--tRNA ligase [Rhodobacteraceae bacterium MED-G07]|nr:MAG: arginine--tRNA ligase [Rhodobacteraceae bacterium MED-G07]
MNLFTHVREILIEVLKELSAQSVLPIDTDFSNITVEPPKDSRHGDMSTNAAMVLSKSVEVKPRELAQIISEALSPKEIISSVDIAGPGFINITLSNFSWHGLLSAVLMSGVNFGKSGMGSSQKVNVEFVSANPTGPLHVGHTRGAVFGDALANLLAYSGYDVTREYYINDGGSQVDVLARSIFLRYQEAFGKEVVFEEGTYPGDYLIPIAKALKEKVGDLYLNKPEDNWLPELRNFAVEAMMNLIRSDLDLLGIEMDTFFSEKSLYGSGKIEAALDRLRDNGLIYKGVLEPPKGKKTDDWEPREQTLFKSTEHGDDVDRPVLKSDGSWTYFAPDIAYHFDKISRGFDILIDVFGADHGGYVKRMKAAVSALSSGEVPLDIKLCQLVKLYQNGEPFKMSKRAGNFVMLRDLVEQVGPDVTRFVMLTRKNDAALDFDFQKVLEQSRENPVFYVQYAHARIKSVIRKAEALNVDTSDYALSEANLSSLTHASELSLIKKLAEWPRIVELSARLYEPHRLAFYLFDLSSELHSHWGKGGENPHLRFLQSDDMTITKSKIALARAVSIVISSGLAILGVQPAEKM